MSRDNSESNVISNFRRVFKVEDVSIDLLKPHPNRARVHSRAQIRKIQLGIRAYGIMKPILVGPGMVIISGHAVVEAAKREGYKELPVICVADLTPDLLRAYMHADNRLAEDGEWNNDVLKIEFEHFIKIPDFDLEVVGFELPEIDIALQQPSTDGDPVDLVPPVTATAISKPGDLWILGRHHILCGDARDPSALALLCDGKQAAVVFCDPPYNVPIQGHVCGNGKSRHQEFAMAAGEMSVEEFTSFLITCLNNLARSSLASSVHFICMDWRHLGELLAAGREVYDAMLNLCIWEKDKPGLGSFYRSQHELIAVFKAGKGTPRNNVQLGRFGRNRSNVWHYPSASTTSRKPGEENVLSFHPTVKPVALIADALLDSSVRGEIVLDSFVGSGSTLLAAERVGRICYGMEYEGRYVDLAIRRWQRLTGEQARHAVTGETFDTNEVSCG